MYVRMWMWMYVRVYVGGYNTWPDGVGISHDGDGDFADRELYRWSKC